MTSHISKAVENINELKTFYKECKKKKKKKNTVLVIPKLHLVRKDYAAIFPFGKIAKGKVKPFQLQPFFGQVQVFFFRKFIASFVFMLERYIRRPLF